MGVNVHIYLGVLVVLIRFYLGISSLGNILSLPSAPPFTFETIVGGVCQIWNISYSSGLSGLAPGSNVNSLSGCFAFSNRLNPSVNMISNMAVLLPIPGILFKSVNCCC